MLEISYRAILKMALPLMASSFIQSVVLITDSAFLSRYDTLDFDASGNAGLLYVTMFIVLSGFNDGVQILMARRIGEKKEGLLSRIFGSSIGVNLVIAILLFGIIQWIIPIGLQSYSLNDVLADKQADFIQIRSFGLFAAIITLACNAYFMAIGKTSYVMRTALLTAVSNIFLDYSMIYGNFGFPELGLKGAALASTLSDFLGMIFLFTILTINKEQKSHELLKRVSIEMEPIKEVLRIGSPIMLQGLVALSVWTVFFTWIEQIGTYELTVSQNIRSIYFLTFVPIWGFGATTKTYISQYLGAQKFDDLRNIQRKIQLLTVFFLLIFVHGAILYPETFVQLINPDVTYTAESASILRMIFGSILLYSFVSVYFQTINGSGNTRITFYIEMASVTVYLFGAYLLIKVYEAPIFWVWTVEYAYFGIIGLMSILYLRKSNWKNKII
jgi:putative MATE family efflux protein